jgi:hypothetical protein
MSTVVRVENATVFVDDNDFVKTSLITNVALSSGNASTAPLPAWLTLQRGRQAGNFGNLGLDKYVFGMITGGDFSNEISEVGDVSELGLVNNSPNEVSDFFEVELRIERNAFDDFDVYGFLNDENGVNLQTLSASGFDFSDIFDGSANSFFTVSTNDTAYIAHDNLVFDNLRLSVSVPEPNSCCFLVLSVLMLAQFGRGNREQEF